ncbi:hypothetical protein KEU06_12535 [Pseudaminobacter sp. 19-2017]|uniref:Uncharacterized protein n=1 Tax=Pseudaminobacter soli (ex Zhang et al. 2022) TaxID=2831468 RepID=A0A942E1T6_9HYPH|nr:hypothetical protein [Pseudaminobacter soli]MBS3649435.1 hypothetical protein [Pseudaminobacter soli]
MDLFNRCGGSPVSIDQRIYVLAAVGAKTFGACELCPLTIVTATSSIAVMQALLDRGIATRRGVMNILGGGVCGGPLAT